ncbi:hypothetical protein [Streptomyces paludis]|uniref:Uncharacterized protein n=1 Tax=Streptomyces paludis TaxID=2282738 RepID=A0A345I184_9ACTN|nr:hypothetical protein [Streptomyces paludis]AXG82708.1 hypothetical protein DVK44_18210 [Streptomyces paludis]
MVSVMGLLEARERAALVRVEELRGEVERVLAGLAEAEAVLERRVIARVELAEALASPGPGLEADGEPVAVAVVTRVPVVGSVVPYWREGLSVEVLAPDYRRMVGVVAEAGGSGVRARELAGRLGLEVVPLRIEGLRRKVKRLVERGWVAEARPGVFTPRRATAG